MLSLYVVHLVVKSIDQREARCFHDFVVCFWLVSGSLAAYISMIFPFGSLIYFFVYISLCQYISRTMLVLLNLIAILFNNIILRNFTPIC